VSAEGLQAAGPVAEAVCHWNGPLRPYFAYGKLDTAQNARVHAMRLAKHFSACHPAG